MHHKKHFNSCSSQGERLADPDYIKQAGENRQTRYRIVEGELIRVWLQKKRGKEKRFRIHTGHPTTTQERERAMATDQQTTAAYRRLSPYCDSLPDSQTQSLDDGLDAEEPYYALSWLIADILENDVTVPNSILLDSYALLDDEDKEEYASLIEKSSRLR